VKVTPPGDIRLAFNFDKTMIKDIIDKQFGDGCGELLISDNKIVLLNRAPDIDKMDEIIVDGCVVGALKYDLVRGYSFLPRLIVANYIKPKLKRGFVIVDDGVDAFLLRGANVLGPGVADACLDIKVNDDVIVFMKNWEVIAVGSAKKNGDKMKSRERGVAVKTRWCGTCKPEPYQNRGQTWDDVLWANKGYLEREIGKAKAFIKNTIANYKKPVAVSLSGGKDSLATLLLLLDVGVKPKILFADTGLEFNETKEHILQIVNDFGLELLTDSAGDIFWRALEYFGPPGRDFRWCCKTCKLAPMGRLIKKNFPDGVLAFIGQRSYESEQRAQKSQVWRNPWVPGQIGASPIQKWTALHVWLYIFSKKVKYNIWYERGLDRIGCWLCPASNLGDIKLIEERYDGYQQWKRFLEEYATKNGHCGDWLKYGMWRWLNPPKPVYELCKPGNGDNDDNKDSRPLKSNPEFISTDGIQRYGDNVSIKGKFDYFIDMKQIVNRLTILGGIESISSDKTHIGSKITIHNDGLFEIRDDNENELFSTLKNVRDIVTRSIHCVGCGLCANQCPKNAITLHENKIQITSELCTHCGKCLQNCPITTFGEVKMFGN
jgi:phosphoadenosine phosphosulfate reductase